MSYTLFSLTIQIFIIFFTITNLAVAIGFHAEADEQNSRGGSSDSNVRVEASKTQEIRLPLGQVALNKEEVMGLGRLELNELIEKLRSEYKIKVVIVDVLTEGLPKNPKLKVNNPGIDPETIKFYRQSTKCSLFCAILRTHP